MVGVDAHRTFAARFTPRVKPLDIVCRHCGVQIGETCQRVVHGRGQNWRKLGRHPHRDRIYDAKKASAAAAALMGD